MPTVVGTDLFDHAITSGYYTAGFAGTPQQDLSIVRPGDPASLLISETGAPEYVQINFSGTQLAWCGYAFRVESVPATAVTIVDLAGATTGNSRIYIDENTRLDCWTLPAGNFPFIAITTGAWYWVEQIADFSGTTFHTYWRVNLTGQAPTTGTTSDSTAGQTANAIDRTRIGTVSSDAVTYRVSRFMYGTAASTSDFLGEQFGGRQYKRFTGPAQLTGSAATLYTVPSGRRARILNIHASNPSAGEVDLNLSIGADAAGTRVYDDFPLAADSVETNYDPYDLAAGDVIQGWASSAGTVVLTVSGYEEPA